MSPSFAAAAARLADTLARENQALAALDLGRAASMLDEKQRVIEGFLAVRAEAEAAPPDAEARALAERLADLSRENQRLLERAIAVQGRIVGLLARAVRTEPQGYARNAKPPARREAITLSARA